MPFPLKIAPLHGGSVPYLMWFLGSTRRSTPNDILVGSAIFAQLPADSPYTLQWAPYFSKLPIPVGAMEPHLIHEYLGPCCMQAHNPNSIFIGSVIFAQFPQSYLYFTMGCSLTPEIAPSCWGCGPHLIRGSLGPPESSTQMTSRSI